jgi:hypothetical protein
MPKPNRGKTEAIKDRAIYVYLPSLDAFSWDYDFVFLKNDCWDAVNG